jgi:hypothetical protein
MNAVPQPLIKCIEDIQSSLQADLVLYSAEISDENADILIEVVRSIREKKDTIVLTLATFGGDPDAAYRITRFLKSHYKKFILFVFGYCKSAGTLIAIGADEIVMSDLAELGPLDIQISRQDDFRSSSGLDLDQALDELTKRIYGTFHACFVKTMYQGGGIISTRTAADIASAIAVGLLSPITAQIDPLRLGENARQIQIAYDYGIRLNPKKADMISQLVSGYSSHSFVIDYQEAKTLFGNVRRPEGAECILEKVFYECVRSPTSEVLIMNLNSFISVDDVKNAGDHENNENNEENEENNNSGETNGQTFVGEQLSFTKPKD